MLAHIYLRDAKYDQALDILFEEKIPLISMQVFPIINQIFEGGKGDDAFDVKASSSRDAAEIELRSTAACVPKQRTVGVRRKRRSSSISRVWTRD